MSCHGDWQKEVILRHNAESPFAPENGQPLKFGIGDHVIYTNDNGVVFNQKITGFYKPEPIDSLYATGCRYLLNTDCYWMPVRENNLSVHSDQGVSQ